MTQLEQSKRAYATLVGRVDSIITKLEKSAAPAPDSRKLSR